MMTEEQFISQIQELWPSVEGEVSELTMEALVEATRDSAAAALRIADQAVRAYPTSAELHCMRGELIWMADTYPIAEALACFRRAADADPGCAHAFELMGDYFDSVEDDPQTARPYYAKSVELGGGPYAYAGLARTTAQIGSASDALAMISSEMCPFHDAPEILELAEEIRQGDWDQN